MLSKRFTHSWQLRGIYTFGKATDETSSNDNGTDNGEAILNPLNIRSQHGLADYNVPGVSPLIAWRRYRQDSSRMVFAKNILGGWRMSNILVLQSGLPFLRIYHGIVQSGPGFERKRDRFCSRAAATSTPDGYAYDLPKHRPKASSHRQPKQFS